MKYTYITLILASIGYTCFSQKAKPEIQKVKDIVIYQDPMFYSSFPSIVKRPDGEFLVAFRRAPDRQVFSEASTNHVDPNSYLVMVRSKDGAHWTQEPELLYAHPFGGSQDPCMLQLKDGTILCTSYGWAFVRPKGLENMKKPYTLVKDEVVFLGGYLLRSMDGGHTWEKPIYPPHVPVDINFNALGQPVPAYNRGGLYEGKNGDVYWIVAASDSTKRTSNHLLKSTDKGLTWQYMSLVAKDGDAAFNEASVYETPKGDIVGFLRTSGMNDQACIARSTDGGKSFEWEPMGFQGHPINALKLPDDRVLLTYGYRHKPYGIRARILNAECTNFKSVKEFVLRSDGGGTDIGYTWPVQLDQDHVLVVYYFNIDDGTRHIAGTIIKI